MPSQKNQDQVKLLTDKLNKATSVVMADYRGLSVNQQQNLRSKITAVNGELIVAKNTLFKLAGKKTAYPVDQLADAFTGPSIILFAYQDPIAPIKVLADFAKDNELPQVKAGFLQKDPLTKEQIETLSKLPTKTELLATTVGTIKAPLNGLVNVLLGNIKNLVYVLTAINIKQSRSD